MQTVIRFSPIRYNASKGLYYLNSLSLTSLNLGQKLSDGKTLGGKDGGLTLLKCDTLQNFYGKAIRENKNNVDGIVNAVWAILKHYSENADHSLCPSGKNSWCSYQKDIANGTSLHLPIKNALRPAVVEVITPLFQRLADRNFIAAVQECYTQNPCESFNHLLWSLAPKEQYSSSIEKSFAVNLSVALFNDGFYKTYSKMMEKCGFKCLNTSKYTWNKLDKERQRRSDYRQRLDVRLKRKKNQKGKMQKTGCFLTCRGNPISVC